jgi:hypothetical protein
MSKKAPHAGVPMSKEYEEMMRHYFPTIPKALISDAWKHHATPVEVRAHLDAGQRAAVSLRRSRRNEP